MFSRSFSPSSNDPLSLAFGDRFALFAGAAFELALSLAVLPLSLANLLLLLRSSVIHPNMKFILMFQSCCIMTVCCPFFFAPSPILAFQRGFCRFIICLFKFILSDPIGAESAAFFAPLQFVYHLAIYSRNFVPHILIVERVLATITVKSYERNPRRFFSLLWCPIAFFLALFNAICAIRDNRRNPMTNFITTVAQFVIGTAEFIIFALLWQYNSRIYQKKSLERIEMSHCLSERYQLSENIRIGKQLVPPLLLTLANIFLGIIILLWEVLDLPNFWLMFIFGTNFNSFFGLLIELFIITCHPFLKRDFCQKLQNFCNFLGLRNRRIDDEMKMTKNSSVVGLAQRELISGRILIEQPKADDYFAILQNAWKEMPNKENKKTESLSLLESPFRG